MEYYVVTKVMMIETVAKWELVMIMFSEKKSRIPFVLYSDSKSVSEFKGNKDSYNTW